MSLLLLSCGSSGDSSQDDDTGPSFTVSVSTDNFNITVNQSFVINYTIDAEDGVQVQHSIITMPTLGTVVVEPVDQTIALNAGNTAGNDSFSIRFSAGAGDNIETQTIEISYTVEADSGGGNNGGNNGNGGEGNPPEPEPEYQIFWPTDYISVFEDEQVSIQLKRNYNSEVNVLETFYLNAANMTGKLSADGSQYNLFIDDAEEDTYGTLVAVAEFEGKVTRSELQIIYFNKNRDLNTVEAPVIALIEPEIEVTIGQTSHLVFDVYDPDSDRLAYRVIDAPLGVQTHINREQEGFELSVSLLSSLEGGSDTLTLEVSDAHNTDQINIALIETLPVPNGDDDTTNDSTTQANLPPILELEQNISVSPTKRLSGSETDRIAEFAFLMDDETPEFVDLSVTSSNEDFEFEINPPYIEIYSEDISELEDEQITLRANDGYFESKLTFHLYVKDNYDEFLGGHPNVAPIIEATDVQPILETKSAEFSISGSDFESHDFTISATANETYLTVEVVDNRVLLTAALLAENNGVDTFVEVTATDVFDSSRTLQVPVSIYKNSAPVVTASVPAVDLVELGSLSVDVSVTDVDETIENVELFYDSSRMDVTFEQGQLTVTANDLTEDFTDTITIRATDEFGATGQLDLPVIIRIDNSPPEIFLSQGEVELAPGQSATVLLTYNDPDGTALTISRFTNNNLLTHAYDQSSGLLTLTLSSEAEFAQSMTFTTTASDGFISVSESLVVTVPIAPEPPNLELLPYVSEIDEEEVLIVNFITSDDNGDDVTISVVDGSTGNIDELDITVFASHVEIAVPDNVLANEVYNLSIVATEDSVSGLSTSMPIQFTVLPVNDPPQLSLTGNQFTLVNDDISTIGISITDVDNDAGDFEIELETAAGNDLPTTLTVHGLDVNSLRISGANKGVVLNNTELVLTVNDGISFTRQSFFVSVTLDNQAPEFNQATNVVQLTENNSVYFDIPITDPDSATDGDTVSISEILVGNTSSANTNTTSVDGIQVRTEGGYSITVTDIEVFPTNTRITIAAGEVTSRTAASLQVIATDGYVSVAHTVSITITDSDPP